MDVRGLILIDDFCRVHHNAEAPLRRWVLIVREAQWANFVECRRSFPHADQVQVRSSVVTVFNIKGNNYRLVVAVSYVDGVAIIRRIMTHKEYSQGRWKELI